MLRLCIWLICFAPCFAFGAEITRVDTALNQLTVSLTPNEARLIPKGSDLKLRFKPKGAFWHATVLSQEGKEAVFQMKGKVGVLRKGLGFRMFDMEEKPLLVNEEKATVAEEDVKMPEEIKGKVARIIKPKNRVVLTFPEVQMVYFKSKDIREKLKIVEVKERTEVEVSIFLKRSDRVVFDVAIEDLLKFQPGMEFLFPIEGVEIEELFPIVPDDYINISGPMSFFSYPRASSNLRYSGGQLKNKRTVDEGEPSESKTALSNLYLNGTYLFGNLGGMRFKYISNTSVVTNEGSDAEVTVDENVIALDMGFQIAGFAAGLGFERYTLANDLIDGSLTLSFNRALVYLGYVTEGFVFSLGYVPKTSAAYSFKDSGVRISKTSDISSEVTIGMHWDPTPTLRLPVELDWYTDDGTSDGVELTSGEKLIALAGMTFGLNSANSLSFALVRNRSAVIPEYARKFNSGDASSARTGLALGYIYSGDLLRTGLGLEYYTGGTQRTAESVDAEGATQETDVIAEQTGIAGGIFLGINY